MQLNLVQLETNNILFVFAELFYEFRLYVPFIYIYIYMTDKKKKDTFALYFLQSRDSIQVKREFSIELWRERERERFVGLNHEKKKALFS